MHIKQAFLHSVLFKTAGEVKRPLVEDNKIWWPPAVVQVILRGFKTYKDQVRLAMVLCAFGSYFCACVGSI